MTFGMQIIYSAAALKDTDVRLFPVSRHRSKRIHKKLVKRFGGEFKREPAIFRMGDKWIVHPVYKREIERETLHIAMTAPVFGW